MISLEDGINEHGLSIALTFLLSKKIKPGINGGFIVRKVLEECKTTDDEYSYEEPYIIEKKKMENGKRMKL